MSNWMITYNSSNDIMHYGVKGRSGRKPGSGSGHTKAKKTVYRKKWHSQKIGGMFYSGHEKSGAAKVMAILRLKNVSDKNKMRALYKVYKSGQIDEKELRKLLSKKPKMLQYLHELSAGKVSKPNATLKSNRPRINSAYDARNYRLQQLYAKKRALTGGK